MHFSHTILCVLGFVSLAAADEKCEQTDAQRTAFGVASLALILGVPECADLLDFSDTAGDDNPEPTPECAEILLKSYSKTCDNVDGLSAKSWVLEATCDGETLPNDAPAGFPLCLPDECSKDDYQKYLNTQIPGGGQDNPFDETCTGDLSVTVTPATPAADEKCGLTDAQDQAYGLASLALILGEPKCADLIDFSDTTGDDDPEPTPECLKAIVPSMNKFCDNVDGLSAKSWVLEATCDGETDSNAGYPTCVPDECSIDDYQKYLSTQISEGGEDNPLDEPCTGDLSVTVTPSSASTFSRMNIIGSVGVILAGVVALM